MDRLANARLALAEKREKQKQKATENAYNLVKNQLANSRATIAAISKELDELKSALSTTTPNSNDVSDPILKDLLNTEQKEADFSEETYSLAIEIHSVSPKAYKVLEERLHFPSERQVIYQKDKILGNFPKDLTDITSLEKISNIYRDKNEIPRSQGLDACLAVDAICFTPDVKITEDSQIYGIEFKQREKKFIPENIYKLFTKNPKELENYITLNYEKLTKAAFVFQVQPYNVAFKPFVIHVYPSPNGKSSEEIVELLHNIRNELRKKHIYIRSFAFDGDNSYLELHRQYYNSYIRKCIDTERINFKRSNVLRVVSDYLHIIKRLRYRLLSCIIHCGFDRESMIIEIDSVKKLLNNIPSVVWSNEKYTKMHDKLPMELFKIENLVKLFNARYYRAASFWFPISLSMVAFNTEGLGFQNRLYLLETVFWFLVYYRESMDEEDVTLRQRKYKEDTHVTFYTTELLIEFTNTIHASIQLMCNCDHFCFDRNFTTPLEHKFGFARRRANDVHTLQKFLRTIAALQSPNVAKKVKKFSKDEGRIKIRGRQSSFGVEVEDKNDDEEIYSIWEYEMNEFCFSPQICAKTILIYAGFDVRFSQIFDPGDVMCYITSFVGELVGDEPQQRKKRKLSLKSLQLGTGQCKRAVSLIQQSSGESKKAIMLNRRDMLSNLLTDKFGHSLDKADYQSVLQLIHEHDPKGPKLPFQKKVDVILDFLVKDFHIYYPFLYANL